MKTLAVVAVSVLLVAVAFVLLAWRVLFVKGGRFPSHHHHTHPRASQPSPRD